MSQAIGNPESSRLSRNSSWQLRNYLDQLRQSRQMIGLVAGAMWGICSIVLVMLLCAWVDVVFALSPHARVGCWLLGLATAVATFSVVVRRNRRSSVNSSLAGLLDASAESSGEVRTGVDLIDLASRRTDESLTAQLARMAVRRAHRVARSVRREEIARPADAMKSAFVVFGVLFLTALAAVVAPRVATAEAKRFFDPYGEHAPYSRYQFEFLLESDFVVYGDDLQVVATVEGPDAEQLQLVLIPPAEQRDASIEQTEPIDVLPMFPDPNGQWRVSVAAIREPFDMYLRVRHSRSELYPIRVRTVPEIRSVQVSTNPPLYSGLAPYVGPVPEDGLEGLPGTEVRLTVRSNRPLAGGLLTLERPDQSVDVPLVVDPVDPSVASGSFLLERIAQAAVRVTDESGQECLRPFRFPVKMIEDLSPFVRMVQPQAVSFATPTALLPVGISAEDDFGIQRCQLFRSLNGSGFLPTDLPLPEGDRRRVTTGARLPLAEYELQPGDEIRLFARVEDNDPRSPYAPVGKGAESKVVSVRIISQQEFQQAQVRKAGLKDMMNRYQQARRRLERLATEMEDLQQQLEQAEPDSPMADDLRQRMAELARQMQQEADAIERLAQQPLPVELDQQLAPQLQQMAENLRQAAQAMDDMAQQQPSNKEAVEAMKQQLANLKQQQQQHQDQAMQPLERLAKILPLKQAESEFVQLVQRQRDLADRLASLKSSAADPGSSEFRARLREFEEQQSNSRQQLTDLLNRIEEHAHTLADDGDLAELKATALKFAEDVRASGATAEMVSCELSLAESDVPQGHTHADKAAEILEGFLSQCEGMGQACEGACEPSFKPGMSSCLKQSLAQLTGSLSFNSGKSGGGTGIGGMAGQSSSMGNSVNVGMYGGLPALSPTAPSGFGSADNAGGTFSDPVAEGLNDGAIGYQGRQANQAVGGGAWGVPAQYRRQVGRYLQNLAEELDE